MTRSRLFLATLLTLLTLSTLAHADDRSRYWVGTGTDWNDPDSWYEYSNEYQGLKYNTTTKRYEPDGDYGVPTSSQQAFLENKQGPMFYDPNDDYRHPFNRPAASKTVTLNTSTEVLSLIVEGDGGGENGRGLMTLDIYGHLKTVGAHLGIYETNNSVSIGRFGEGKIIVNSGASLTAAKALVLGSGYWTTPSVGTLDILDGIVHVGTWETIGGIGIGHVNQTGGLHTTGGDMEVHAKSDVKISGGTMQVGNQLRVGTGSALAYIEQSGDSQVTVGTDMHLSKNAKYTMTENGSLLVNGYSYVGQNGIASMTLNDTSVHTTGQLTLGDVTGGNGTYIVNGGWVNVVTNARIGRWGTGNLELKSGSTMDVGDTMWVGVEKTDAYNATSGVGIVDIESGATLNANHLIVGNGGTGSVISNGKIGVTGTTLVGFGLGEMLVEGATAEHKTDVLKVAEGVNSVGTYTLNGGILDVTNAALIGIKGNGTLNLLSGGTMVVTNHMVLGVDGNATTRGSGTVSTGVGTQLTVNDLMVGGAGDGAFAQGGSVTVLNDLKVASEAISNGNYSLGSSANLAVSRDEIVSENGKGTFVQNGGTHAVFNNLIVAKEVGSGTSGTEFTLDNGLLQVFNSEIIGQRGNGDFAQLNGTNYVGVDLILGSETGSSGTYLMEDGNLQVNQGIIAGNEGKGLFTQTGGAIYTSALEIGNGVTGSGEYVLAGGAIQSDGIIVGNEGNGSFTQESGINETRGIVLGSAQTSSGEFKMNGGVLDVQGPAVIGSEGNGNLEITAGEVHFKNNVVVGAQAGANGIITFNTNNGDFDRGRFAMNFMDVDELEYEFKDSGIPEISDDLVARQLAEAVDQLKADPANVWGSQQAFIDAMKAKMIEEQKARLIAGNPELMAKLSKQSPLSDNDSAMAVTRGQMSLTQIAQAKIESFLKQSNTPELSDPTKAAEVAAALKAMNVSKTLQGMVNPWTLEQNLKDDLMGRGFDEAQAQATAQSVANDSELWMKMGAESPIASQYDRAVAAQGDIQAKKGRQAYGQLTEAKVEEILSNSGLAEFADSENAQKAAAAAKEIMRTNAAKDVSDGVSFQTKMEAQLLSQGMSPFQAQVMANRLANNLNLLKTASQQAPVQVDSERAIASRGVSALATANGRQLEKILTDSGMSQAHAKNLVLEVINVAENEPANLFKPTTGGASAELHATLASGGANAVDVNTLLTNQDILRRVGEASPLSTNVDKVVSDWGRVGMGSINQMALQQALVDSRISSSEASAVVDEIMDIRQNASASAFGSSANLESELISRGIDSSLAKQVANDTEVLARVAEGRGINEDSMSTGERGLASLSVMSRQTMEQALKTSRVGELSKTSVAQNVAAAMSDIQAKKGAGVWNDPTSLQVELESRGIDSAIAGQVVNNQTFLKRAGDLGVFSQNKMNDVMAQSNTSLMGMNRAQIEEVFTDVKLGGAGASDEDNLDLARRAADAIVQMQDDTSKAFSIQSIKDALINKGIDEQTAGVIAGSPGVFTKASQKSGLYAGVAESANTKARQELMAMSKLAMENALRKSRDPNVSDQKTAKAIADALDQVRNTESQEAFASADHLREALKRQGISQELAEKIANDEQILNSFTSESAKQSNPSTYSDSEILFDDNLFVGTGGNGTVVHDAGSVWVKNSVVVGSQVGSSGIYAMNGGALEASEVNVEETGIVSQSGGTIQADSINNRGTFNVSGGQVGATIISNDGQLNLNGGNLVVSGDVINQENGQVKVTDANVEYTGEFINFGEYNSDPSINTFIDLYVGDTGYLIGGAGDEFMITGDFFNDSLQDGLWNTNNALLRFGGFGIHNYTLNDTSAGFGWDTLALEDANGLNILGDFSEDLYFKKIILGGGLDQLVMINSGSAIYFDEIFDGQGTLLDLTTYDLEGGGTFQKRGYIPPDSSAVPEPATMLLFGSGLVGMMFRRSRKVSHDLQ